MFRVVLLLLLFFAKTISSQGNNPNFEFSGVDQFWKIVNIFNSNGEPSKNDWKKLFSTPGYKVLTNGEFERKFFIDNFRLVFKPAEKNNLKKALKTGRNIHYLKHYIKIKNNREKVRDQLKALKRNDFNRTAVRKTLEYLPQNNVNIYPPVSFLIFESNGRGSSPIVVDLAASIEWDFMNFLSHEFHHWYRNRQLKINLRKVSSNERDLINALSLIEAEGIADMVDKKDWYTKPSSSISEYARHYLNDVRRTPKILKKIDEALKNIKNKPGQSKNLGRRIFGYLPQRGHTTGYFMARLILEKFSKQDLAKCVGNPFEFIILYNKAANRTSGRYPRFSKESIELVHFLNQKYQI